MKIATKNLILTIGLIAIVAIFIYKAGIYPATHYVQPYQNLTYKIDGKEVPLRDGIAEEEIVPGSASKVVTKIFGNLAGGDFDNDGNSDTAFLLTQSGGGSGTFFYIAAALNTSAGWKGTNAIMLGDRISPQTTEVRDGKIVVNYADRNVGEPMSMSPSVGVTKYFAVKDGLLQEVTK